MFGAPIAKEKTWVEANVPSQEGKVFVITGANSGIGLEATRILASKQGKVIMACRNEAKARQAIDDLVNGVSEPYYKGTPSPFKVERENLDFIQLDMADLNSVEQFSKEVLEKYPKIDALICNAGLMMVPKREETAQGCEMQMGVNVVAHYALTCRLIPALANALSAGGPAPRIVMVSSGAHKQTASTGINFKDFDKKENYAPFAAYADSKLGNMLLMSQFADIYPQFTVVGAHPGLAATNLLAGNSLESVAVFFAQSAMMGGLPLVMAAVDPTVAPKEYFGPYWNAWGLPTRAGISPLVKNKTMSEQLFKVCEEKTGLAPPSL